MSSFFPGKKWGAEDKFSCAKKFLINFMKPSFKKVEYGWKAKHHKAICQLGEGEVRECREYIEK